MFQPSVHISQFHGFNLVQFAYSYESLHCLNFHFAKLSLHIAICGASTASYNVQFTSVQMTTLETLKSWEDMDAESWKKLNSKHIEKTFFPHFNVKRLMTLNKF